MSIVTAIAASMYAAVELRLNADTSDLIAPGKDYIGDFREFQHEFGDLEYIYIVVENGIEGERTKQAIDFLAARLSMLEAVPELFYSIEPEEQLRIATRAMDAEELESLAQAARAFPALVNKSSAAAAIALANEDLQRLLDPSAALTEDEREATAASAVFLLTSIAAALPDSASADDMAFLLGRTLERQYLSSKSGKLHFIHIAPHADYGRLDAIRQPLAQIRAAIEETQHIYPELSIGLTGKPVLYADELATSDRDMRRAAIMAIILIAILFMIVVGGVWHPTLAVLALGIGIAWTFGLTTLIIGQLNILSIVFTLILVGVGIDFGVHLVTRYREERLTKDIEDGIRDALLTAGRANVAGAITSSMAFFAALLTGFQGLRELGFIAGSGLLLCLISMTLVLPAMLVVFDRHRGSQTLEAMRKRGGPKHSRIFDTVIARPATVLLAVLAVTLLIAPGALRIDFQENLLELQARGVESVVWEHRILEDSHDTWFGAIIAESQDEVLALVQRSESLPNIGSVRSVFDMVEPETARRHEMRTALHNESLAHAARNPDMWSLDELNRAVNSLNMLAQAIGDPNLIALGDDLMDIIGHVENPSTSEEMRALIDSTAARIGVSLDIMLAGDSMSLRDALPRAVRERFISPAGRYLVSAHPVENVWEPEPMRAFVADLRVLDPHVTGVPITQLESLIEMRQAFLTAAAVAMFAVFMLIWLDFRSLREATLATLPLACGLFWLVAFMGWLDVRFNLANFFAVPILIGIGVDSGIHILRRHREEMPGAVDLGSTRRAVFTTSMTSIIGFGMLATASHRGVQSLGIVMAMGAALLLVASVVLLPALLTWLESRDQRRRERLLAREQHETQRNGGEARRQSAKVVSAAYR